MKVTLRPVGRGNWRPLVLEVTGYPRRQGSLFRGHPARGAASIDAELDLVKRGDTWVIDGRPWRVAEVKT
jgi:hypothetical protein